VNEYDMSWQQEAGQKESRDSGSAMKIELVRLHLGPILERWWS
jgi:hypothetical protein